MYVCEGKGKREFQKEEAFSLSLRPGSDANTLGDFPLCVSVSFAFHMWRQMAVACVNQTNQSPEVEVDDDSTTSSVISLFSLL